MIEMYGGGPVGLGTLSVNIAEERETVEDMYEPYLIQKDLLCEHEQDVLQRLKPMNTWGTTTLKKVDKNPSKVDSFCLVKKENKEKRKKNF